MKRVLAKTLGGLSPSYYARQFMFALIFPGMALFAVSHSSHSMPLAAIFYLAVNTLLYPYSRFVYESVANFIIGQNVFYGNAVFFIALKITTMAFCWSFATILAPLGLVYLYFYHSKSEKR